MKKLNSLLLIAAILLTMSCSTKETSLSGQVESYPFDNISLYRVEGGELVLVEVQHLNSDSLFNFSIPEGKSGFYYMGINDEVKSVFADVFLNKGSSEHLVVKGKTIDTSTLSDQELVACKADWEVILKEYGQRVFREAREANLIAEVINDFDAARKSFATNIKTSNSTFNRLMKLRALVDFEIIWLRAFSMSHEPVSSIMLEQPAFKAMLANPLSTVEILDINNGSQLMSSYTTFKARNSVEKPTDYLKFCMDVFNNDTLKGQYLMQHIIYRKVSGKDYENLMAEYRKYVLTAQQKRELAAYEKAITKFAAGQEANDFRYADANGQFHALSDYKGKVVLVDVWATWCAPCKAEIPHLEKLIEHYKNNDNIVFIGVSIDKPKDRDKWLAFVEEHHLKGIQLMADNAFKSQILLDYEITGVPRFMLFDKEGKIVSVNAARPSNPRLKELINGVLGA